MKLTGDNESSRRKGRVANDGDDRWGTVMDEKLEMSSGSDYEPGEGDDDDSEGSISLEEESMGDFEKGECSRSSEEEEEDGEAGDEDRRGQKGKRKRVGVIEGRRWRRKAAGDGVPFDGRAQSGQVSVSVRGRCTLELICAFKKTFEEHHVEAVKATILKHVLQYKPFAMQRELTTALVLAWVPRRRGFRLGGRVVPFSVFDVALFTGLPATGDIVKFGEDGDTTEVGSLLRQRMAEYVEAKQGKLGRG